MLRSSATKTRASPGSTIFAGVVSFVLEVEMIRGVHTMFYSSEPEALRAFLRDKLGFAATDVGEGWLIFDLPEADMGCHPADEANGAKSGTHDISFYCDDIEKTVADLSARGVEFSGPVVDQGYGLVTHFRVPGGFEVQLYQPRYTKGPA
jgi:catechol 2,3-dioxygenase-like lactoylglutathione lyase family enzyme